MTISRTRWRESGLAPVTIRQDSNWSDGTHYAENDWPGNSQVITDGERKVTQDVPHANFRKRIQNGEIILGDLSITNVRIDSDTNDFQLGPFYPEWGRTRISGKLATYGAPSIDDAELIGRLNHAQELALVKVYAKMNKAPLMTGEFLHGFKQTLSMLRRPLKASTDLLVKMYKFRKKSLGKTAHSAAQASANAWLEYRYGWQPLIMDIDESINETNKFRETMRSRRLVARSTENVDFNVVEDLPPWYPSTYWVSLRSTVRRAIKAKGSAHAGVIYEVKPQTTGENIARIMGVRARDLPATLWEIVPFSFVADWFVNVGDWLEAVTPDPSVTVLGNWVTCVGSWNCEQFVTFYYPPVLPGLPSTEKYVGSTRQSRTILRRLCNQSLASFPVMTKRNLSNLHLTDALSLSVNKISNLLRGLKH